MRRLIAAALTAGALAGCGGGSETTVSSTATSASVDTMSDTLAATPATPAPVEPVQLSDPEALLSSSEDAPSAVTLATAQVVPCTTRKCSVAGVTTSPTASFNALPFGSVVGTTVQFTDTSGVSPTSWAWDFGDGTTSRLQHPTHTYQRAGAYIVSLTSSNAAGSNVHRAAYRVTIAGVPPSPAMGVFPAGGRVNAAVKFTDQSTSGPTSWAWTFGDGGTSTEANPVHQYTAPGTYTVTLNVTNAVGTKTTKMAYVVAAATAAPVSSFTSWPNSPSAGMPVHFENVSTGGPEIWKWDFGDGSSSDEVSPVHSYSKPGTYRVALRATTKGATQSAIAYKTVTVVAGTLPVALFSISPMGSSVAGESVWFKDDSVGSPVSWSWDFGDGAVSTLQHPSHAYARAGQYTVSLVVTDTNGATQKLSHGRTVVGNMRTPPSEWTQAWLSSHASARAGLLSGVLVVPAPSPALEPFTWSVASAEVAQGWADQCNLAHNQNRNLDGFGASVLRGESIWASPSSSSGDTRAANIVAKWGDEYRHYNYNTLTCEPGKVCGHYLQLVYRKTTQVGCSMPTSCSVPAIDAPLAFKFSESYLKNGFTIAACDYSSPYDSFGKPY